MIAGKPQRHLKNTEKHEQEVYSSWLLQQQQEMEQQAMEDGGSEALYKGLASITMKSSANLNMKRKKIFWALRKNL